MLGIWNELGRILKEDDVDISRFQLITRYFDMSSVLLENDVSYFVGDTGGRPTDLPAGQLSFMPLPFKA